MHSRDPASYIFSGKQALVIYSEVKGTLQDLSVVQVDILKRLQRRPETLRLHEVIEVPFLMGLSLESWHAHKERKCERAYMKRQWRGSLHALCLATVLPRIKAIILEHFW